MPCFFKKMGWQSLLYGKMNLNLGSLALNALSCLVHYNAICRTAPGTRGLFNHYITTSLTVCLNFASCFGCDYFVPLHFFYIKHFFFAKFQHAKNTIVFTFWNLFISDNCFFFIKKKVLFNHQGLYLEDKFI